MKRIAAALAVFTVLFSNPAQAQSSDPFTGFYTVGEIGYENGPAGFDQFIFGGAVGYSIPLNDQFYVAGEGEIHWSESGLVDFTWGFTGNVGFRLDEDLAVFARAGYREFNFDGFGSDGDYTLGLGIQFALTENLSFRPLIDTVAFDTVGVRAGVAFTF